MHKASIVTAILAAACLVSGVAVAEQSEKPRVERADREREMDQILEILEKIEDLDRRRDQLIDKKGLEEDHPEVREVNKNIEERHRELAELTREGRHLEHPGLHPPPPPPHEGPPRPRHRPASPELLKKLETAMPETEFNEVPFKQVIEFLREQQKVNIHVDWRPLQQEIEVDKETPVVVEKLTNVPFETVLRMVLRATALEPGMLGYYLDGSVIVITTWERLPEPAFRPPPVEEVLERLRRDRPEVHERLMALRREHPERFERELRKLVRRVEPALREERERRELEELRRHHPERFELIRRDRELTDRTVELAERIRRNETSDEKDKLTGKLRKLLDEQFEVRMKVRRLEAEELRARLDELTAILDRRAKNKSALVEQRMNQLLHPEETEW